MPIIKITIDLVIIAVCAVLIKVLMKIKKEDRDE